MPGALCEQQIIWDFFEAILSFRQQIQTDSTSSLINTEYTQTAVVILSNTFQWKQLQCWRVHLEQATLADLCTAYLQLSAYSFLMKAGVFVLLTSSLCCHHPIASTTVLSQNRVCQICCRLIWNKENKCTKMFCAAQTLPRIPIFWLARNSGKLPLKRHRTPVQNIKMTLWNSQCLIESHCSLLSRQKLVLRFWPSCSWLEAAPRLLSEEWSAKSWQMTVLKEKKNKTGVSKVFSIVKSDYAPAPQTKYHVYYIFQYSYHYAFILIFITCQPAKFSNRHIKSRIRWRRRPTWHEGQWKPLKSQDQIHHYKLMIILTFLFLFSLVLMQITVQVALVYWLLV